MSRPPHPPALDAQPCLPKPEHAISTERRIRWERRPENEGRLIVLDALTGHVIAVVRSLFEMRSH